MKLQTNMKLLPGTYRAKPYAKTYMSISLHKGLEVRKTGSGDDAWAYIYFKGKQVWDCNWVFFEAHFTKET